MNEFEIQVFIFEENIVVNSDHRLERDLFYSSTTQAGYPPNSIQNLGALERYFSIYNFLG